MEKQELLNHLTQQLQNGSIRPNEIRQILDRYQPLPAATPSHHADDNAYQPFTKIFYVIGAVMIILGIAIFNSHIWSQLNSAMRILLTLGLGILFAGTGSFFLIKNIGGKLGAIFHLIGGFLIPYGAIITLLVMYAHTPAPGSWSLVVAYGLIFAVYLALAIYHQEYVIELFTLINGTAFIVSLIGAIMGLSILEHPHIFNHIIMVISAGYLGLATYFRHKWNTKLCGLLFFLGSFGFLFAAFYQIYYSTFWLWAFVFLTVGGVVFAVYLKSRSMLVLSTLFLILYMTYITYHYFTHSIGWPVTLLILGIITLGLGYLSIQLNKRYIK